MLLASRPRASRDGIFVLDSSDPGDRALYGWSRRRERLRPLRRGGNNHDRGRGDWRRLRRDRAQSQIRRHDDQTLGAGLTPDERRRPSELAVASAAEREQLCWQQHRLPPDQP